MGFAHESAAYGSGCAESDVQGVRDRTAGAQLLRRVWCGGVKLSKSNNQSYGRLGLKALQSAVVSAFTTQRIYRTNSCIIPQIIDIVPIVCYN